MFIDLKPLSERKINGEHVIARLRPKLMNLTGARLYLSGESRTSAPAAARANAQYQYTLLADNLTDLTTWAPKITAALKNMPELEDVNSDQQDKGLDVRLNIDRATAARLGINLTEVDNTLYDAFGQRQVSTIYKT